MSRGYWEELERPAPDAVEVDGVELRRRSRVRLKPRPGGDVFDLALAGRTGVVEGIEQDLEGKVLLAVVVDDDPGRDLGHRRSRAIASSSRPPRSSPSPTRPRRPPSGCSWPGSATCSSATTASAWRS